jgi:2-dehydro-3-deoxyphosphooctonate aldolase (KDO 8-P synthase)
MFKLIAGPCVIENEELCIQIAKTLKPICEKYGIDYFFKASFDKANRTSISSFRGPGIDEGLKILNKVKKEVGVKICTDIHEPWQASRAAEVADIIQIPAFLCRQTDLLVAAAKTGKTINVKKAQFFAPWDMKNVLGKLEESGASNIWLCERGSSFGYNNLVVDFTGIIEMKKFGYPVVFDATHSVQKPGGKGTSTGGNREYVPYLAKAAIAVGADVIFMETHPNPEVALSDGPNSVALKDVDKILGELCVLYKAVNGHE